MNIKPLTYKKSTGALLARDAEKKQKTTTISVVPKESVSIPEIPYSTYRKDDASVSASIIFVLSGGEEREKNILSR